MMAKLRKIILVPALSTVSVSGFFSCGVDRWSEYAYQTALDIWTYDIMQRNYLWYRDLPSYNNVNLFLGPASLLSKVKSENDSCPFVDSVMETPLPTYGFGYSLVRSADIDTAYNALIIYVVPGLPAEATGLGHRNWIMKVDTSYISKRYEAQLLQGTQARDSVMGVWKEVPAEPEEGEEGEKEFIYKVVPDDMVLKLPVARSVGDNPMHETKILTAKEDDRDIEVGYPMYNSFTAGTNGDPDKYDNELQQISREFKIISIKYVIPDLRYNTGGSLDCVQLLDTILTSEARLNKPMTYLKYNNKNRNKDTTINFDSEILKDGVSLDLPTLFAITSSTTAGAPEILIRNLSLKDSYPIVTIGGVTKGRNIATGQFISEGFLWSINPVVRTTYDSNHGAGGVIPPATGLKISETTIGGVANHSEFLSFSNSGERMLKVAIGVIDGNYPPKGEETGETTET